MLLCNHFVNSYQCRTVIKNVAAHIWSLFSTLLPHRLNQPCGLQEVEVEYRLGCKKYAQQYWIRCRNSFTTSSASVFTSLDYCSIAIGDESTYAMVLKFSRTILQSSHSYIV